MADEALKIAMFGHKHMLSREGGIEVVVKELSTRLAERGHKVICYDRSSRHVSGEKIEQSREYQGVKIVPVWTVERKGLAALTSSISAAIRVSRSSADIVHIHAEGPAFMAWLPKVYGKKVVVTIHGLDWQRAKWGRMAKWYIKLGERIAVKYADRIIVLSSGLQDYFRDTYRRDSTFIPNGVGKAEKRPAQEINSRWGLEKDGYVLFLGRIVPEKGLIYLIQAWKKIKTDKKLVIAGGSSDTEEFMEELKTAADDSVVFTGFQQGMILEELYSNCYVYVLPSDLEGMPLSLLEAMSYGCCCVVSDIKECTEVVEDKAVTFRKSDEMDLKEKLQGLIERPDLVAGYKEYVVEFVHRKYSWDTVVERTLELYRS